MQDTFGRTVSYIRVSVTDRCDFRCHYCMAEHMTFLPRQDLLSIEELDRVCSAFISLGVRKLRLTGGEPLVRRGIMTLVKDLSRHLESGALDELTMTTNGTQLARHAADLAALGMRRINISLDTLNPETFRSITRLGTIEQTLSGISAARDAGLAIKINTVALRGINEHEIADMVAWCGREGYDMTLIETMPLGDIGGDRSDHYLPLSQVRQDLERRFTLTPSSHNTGGPSRYVDVQETQRRVGFITPLTEHFCDTCNRVRLTCTGTLYMCLGQEDSVDLRQPLRANESNQPLLDAIATAIARKPRGHDFVIDKSHRGPALTRHMNTTGG